MTLAAVVSPYQPINGLTGLGLNSGALYIGLDGQDPQAFPQNCYWDAAGTILAAQPISIQGGYPMRLGTPARLYTAATFSIRVRDATGVQVFYEAHAVPVAPPTTGTFATLAAAVAALIPVITQGFGITLAGYLAAGDLGGGYYRYAPVQAAGVGKFQSADGAWWELVEPMPRPEQFGGFAGSANDATAGFASAFAYAVARNTDVWASASPYYVHELAWPSPGPSLKGAETGITILRYNGAGGAASCVIKMPNGTGAIAYTGFYNLVIDGFSDVTHKIAENCIRGGTEGVDWGLKFENLALRNCFGDALDFSHSQSIVNLFMNRMRFDSIGGFNISLTGNGTLSGDPVVLREFTWDNLIAGGAFTTAATAAGYYDGSRWGAGIIKAIDCAQVHIRISDARIELNDKMVATGGATALVYSANSIAGTETTVILENISGVGRDDQAILGVKAVNGRTNLVVADFDMSSIAKLFETTDANYSRDIITNLGASFISSERNGQHNQGINIGGRWIESRGDTPANLNASAFYKQGDFIFNNAPASGGKLGWVCTAPAVGYAQGAVFAIDTAAHCTAGSATITVTSGKIRSLKLGLNVTLAGAGVAGVDLATYISGVDETTSTITVNTAPSTSVNPLTISSIAATFVATGIVGGVQVAHQANSTAAVLADLVTDFNALLAKLQAAKLQA